MALTDITIDFDLAQILGSDFDPRRTKAYVTTNVESGTLMDTTTGETRLGDEAVTIAADGTGSFTTWATGADGNPASWQTSLVVDYPRTGQRDRKRRVFGPWTLTTADDGKNIVELETEQAVPAEYLTTVTAELQTYSDSASASATTAASSATSAAAAATLAQTLVTSDLGTTDGQSYALVTDLNSQTGGALLDMYAGKHEPLALLASQRVEIQRDSAPLDYTNTKAVFVIQARDEADLPDQNFSPGVVFQFVSTGDGFVNAGAKYSGSIWTGLFAAATKYGDGSQHAFTATGELREVGPVGYNELGGFQGELTNIASTNGNISGVELLLKDSPDGGTTSFDTAMKGIIGRIAKFSATRNNRTTAFFASSEGSVAPDSILSVNGTPAAPNAWNAGIDLSGASFGTGVAAILPNNTGINFLDSALASRPIFGVSATNITYLRPASAAAYIDFQTYAGGSALQINGTNGRTTLNATAGNIADFQAGGVTKLSVQSDGTLAFGTGPTTLAVGAAGAASAMPTPDGYLYVYIGGVAKRLAYFN